MTARGLARRMYGGIVLTVLLACIVAGATLALLAGTAVVLVCAALACVAAATTVVVLWAPGRLLWDVAATVWVVRSVVCALAARLGPLMWNAYSLS